jgi:hypothetical protein
MQDSAQRVRELILPQRFRIKATFSGMSQLTRLIAETGPLHIFTASQMSDRAIFRQLTAEARTMRVDSDTSTL